VSIFTSLRDCDLPTAAKLQRLWAHCILTHLIRDLPGWPSSTIEHRLMKFGAGATQASKGIGLTFTESAIDRLRRSLDLGLWVQSQLLQLGPVRYGVAYFSYVEELDAGEIAAIIDTEPREVLNHRLVTARYLNRCVKHAAKQAGVVA
jgi:hypothetical protein